MVSRFRSGLTAEWKLRWLWPAFAVIGFLYSVVTGPFRAPDEYNHFLRAYQISEGRFVPERLGQGHVGAELPESLAALLELAGGSPDPKSHRIDWAGTKSAAALKLRPERRIFFEYANTAIYSPLPYLPSAGAIAVGRVFGAGPLTLVYFARWANVLVCSGLTTLGLCRLHLGRWPALLVASLPMAMSQMAMVTTDAILFAAAIFWVALVTSLAFARVGRVTSREMLALILLALVFSQMRPPYPILATLVCLIGSDQIGGRARRVALVVAVVFAAALPAVAWNEMAAPYYVPGRSDVQIDPREQAHWIASDPAAFVRVLFRDVTTNAGIYWWQAVGWLGWLTLPLPRWLAASAITVLAFSCCLGSEKNRLPVLWQRLAIVAICICGALAVDLLLYLSFTRVSARKVWGLQGRYYIPFLLPLSIAFSNRILATSSLRLAVPTACCVFPLVANFTALFLLARAGGLF